MAEITCDLLTSKAEPPVGAKVDRSSRTARRQKGVTRRGRMASGVPREHHRIKGSSSNSNSDYRIGVCYGSNSVTGRSREMEDAVAARPFFVSSDQNVHFFGVFDGHGCYHVANLCRDRMHILVSEEMAVDEKVDWKAVVERSYARMDSEVSLGEERNRNSRMSCRCKPGKSEHVGSTAVIAVISPDHIVVGNCGDSRAVLLRGSSAVPLSSDHKPDREDELQRIEGEGGKVIYWDGARVLGVLAMSRSIGDNYLKPYVTSEPEVTITARTNEDECLLLASDGLWDVISNETACNVAKRCLVARRSASEVEGTTTTTIEDTGSDEACIGAAMSLCKIAIAKGSTDDITVVVVNLKGG